METLFVTNERRASAVINGTNIGKYFWKNEAASSSDFISSTRVSPGLMKETCNAAIGNQKKKDARRNIFHKRSKIHTFLKHFNTTGIIDETSFQHVKTKRKMKRGEVSGN